MSLVEGFAWGTDTNKYGKGSVKSFYNKPKNYKDWKSKYLETGSGYSLKEGYISSSTPLHSGYGDTLYSKASIGNKGTSGLYIYYDPEAAAAKASEARHAKLQATVDKASAYNAKQLKILQNEKSAVSKMMSEYSAQLKAEADRRVKAQETARISAATSAANQARQGQAGNLQIQPASQTPTTTGGTRAFKRTGISPAGTFTTGISGMVNI